MRIVYGGITTLANFQFRVHMQQRRISQGDLMLSSPSHLLSRRFATFITIILTLVLAAGAHAETFKVLHAFGVAAGDGNLPSSPLLKDSAGNLYGMTSAGGAHNLGTVYRLSPTSTGS